MNDEELEQECQDKNVIDEIGNKISNDDLLGQALDAGKATWEFGKKTGKLLFNVGRIGLTKLMGVANNSMASNQQMLDKTDQEKEKLKYKSNDELIDIWRSPSNNIEKGAVGLLLKERGINPD
jgi:hypothetical protein